MSAISAGSSSSARIFRARRHSRRASRVSQDGGRIYTTAILTLCLEVHYRYVRVAGAKKR